MTRLIHIFLIFVFGFYLSGCAGLGTDYETPVVSITSFKAIPGEGIVPGFEIGLRIVNPNRSALDLKGISYSITLEGRKILTGVSNKLPTIEAYGQGDVLLEASVDFFNSIGFFSDLAKNRKQERFTYSLDGKLDVGALHPIIRVSKKGHLFLFDSRQNQ
ncbi:MAG: LEA type 2 family protein [Proteobacteria bacterium]|nr:LEA type 2 family protein [Pseudomonadota bacterium]MBU4130304.1 LEA type 2 family protein [Pseudomonadota bacterium]